MQRWLTLFLFQWITLISVAQNREIVTARGFNNMGWNVDSLPGNQWIFATISSLAEGSIYTDTITLWFCDSTGKVFNRITSLPAVQNEINQLDLLIGLADTSALIQYSGGDCDACCYTQVLEKWNKDGTLAWQKIEYKDPSPSIFSATKNKRLFAQKGYQILELDWNTGDTIWQYEYDNQYLTGIAFIPGTADFIAYRNEKISRYEMDTTGVLKYNLKATLPYNNMMYDFKVTKEGILYGREYGQIPKLVRFNAALSSFKEFTVTQYLQDYTPIEDGVIMLLRPNNSNYELTIKDTLGHDTKIFTNPNNQLLGYKLKSNTFGFALTGQYTAGINDDKKSTQGWFRYFPEDSLNQHLQKFSVGITNINQRSPVNVDSTFYDNPDFMGYLHNINGGDFEMEVTNTGDQPVDSFWINTRFESAWFIWFCGLDMCKNVLYHNHLDPGESAWVDFGDIYAINQFSLPGQYCFWTSGPSARPDDIPQDDSKCVDRIVSTHDLQKTSLSFYPQPASDEIIISNLPDPNNALMAIIYSLEGKICKTELLDMSQDHYYLSIGDLPNGYYILKINQQVTSLVVAHHN